MKNIFLLYVPPENYEAAVHYEDTIKRGVDQARIIPRVNSALAFRLENIFGSKRIAVWGSRDTPANRSKFDRMKPGDHMLVVEGVTIKLLGEIAAKTVNAELSRELWKNLRISSTEGWNLIYFIANPIEIGLPFSTLNQLFGYSPDYRLHGFTAISEAKLERFYSEYEDFYSVLQRLKAGMPIEKKDRDVYQRAVEEMESTEHAFAEEEVTYDVSDHVLMQWKLIQLGVKAGSKVWVPKNDQQKIATAYRFDRFETEFTAGIDTPAKYVENIDVVWKDQYRIDAAFEIENSTAIYSGLLRFSDLKIIAPNSNYPLFVVAPTTRRNRLVEQIRRPTFKKLEFESKVRYLSYENVDRIYGFFETAKSGLNVEVLMGHSEALD
jgi:hypothetical protein